jgi:hypothetical protein
MADNGCERYSAVLVSLVLACIGQSYLTILLLFFRTELPARSPALKHKADRATKPAFTQAPSQDACARGPVGDKRGESGKDNRRMRILITGANEEGLGGAIALRLAAEARAVGEQCTLALCTSGNRSNGGLVDELAGMGARVVTLHGDLGNPETPARLVDAAVAFAGGLDGVVANAGIMKPGRLTKLSVDD